MLLVILGCYCNSKWPDEKKWLCTFTETNHDGQHTLEEKREKYNLTVLSNSYWSPFLLPFENIINLVCVSVWTRACVSVCVCACMLLLLCTGKFKGVYLCAKPLVLLWSFDRLGTRHHFKGQIRQSVTLAWCSILFTLGQNVLHLFLCPFSLPSVLPSPLHTFRVLHNWPLPCFLYTTQKPIWRKFLCVWALCACKRCAHMRLCMWVLFPQHW